MPPATGPRGWRRHWPLLALIAIGFGPFVPSILETRDVLLSDNAVGFVPLMIPAAVAVFWLRAHRSDPPERRDVLLDAFFALPLLGLALFILLVIPGQLSWYFWLHRNDLLAMSLAVAGVAVVVMGYQQVLRTWPAWVLLFFAWPWPAVRLQAELTDPFVTATAWVSARVVGFLRLPYEQDPVFSDVFTSTHLARDENFVLVVAQTCSGTATFIGFALFGLTIALLVRGSILRRVRWLAIGGALALLANFVRVAVLFIVASEVGLDTAIDTVHPLLGLALFGLLLFGMLLLLGPLGLSLDLGRAGRHTAWEPRPGGGRPLVAMWGAAVAAAVALGVASIGVLDEMAFLGDGSGAPTVDVADTRAILPEVPGWELEHIEQVSWTDLFGRRSRGDLFAYSYPGGPSIVVQSIIADERGTLDRYRPEQCTVFHGEEVDGVRYVALPYATTGVLFHDSFRDVAGSTLYWQFPVRVDGELRHARVSLLLDVAQPVKPVDLSTLPSAGSLSARVGVDLANRFDGFEPADPERRQIDLELVELASLVIEALVERPPPAPQAAPAPAASGAG